MNYLFLRKQTILALIGSSLLAILAGCGVSTDTGSPTDISTSINEFTLTSNGNTGAFVPIDFGSENSVLFDMTWDLSSSDPYFVTIRLSDDANASLDDQIILETTCGSFTDYICTFVGAQECGISYEPDGLIDHYYLRCSHGPATIDTAEITLRLQNAGFPGASLINFILFTACNGALDSCSTAAVQVQIYDSIP